MGDHWSPTLHLTTTMKVLLVALVFTVSCTLAKPSAIQDNPSVRWRFCKWFPHWDICQSPFECTAEGLFPDPNDCTQFHACQDAGDGFFIEHDMSCPHDLLFISILGHYLRKIYYHF